MPEIIEVPSRAFLDTMHDGQCEVLSDFNKRVHRFFLINFARRLRKTTLALNILIQEACEHSNSRYGYITSTFTAAKSIAWRDPNMLKKWLPTEFVKKFNESELFVEFKNGSILSLHGSDRPDSIRGVDFRGIVIDEAPLCKRELYEEILRPIVAQGLERWMIFIFTPKGKASWIYEYWCKMRDNPEWGRYMLNAEDSGLFTMEELEKAKTEMPARVYAQEMMCSFEESSAGVFKNVQECIAGQYDSYRQDKTYVTGVDLAKINDFTVLTTIERETRRIVAWERFNQVDWSYQKEKILAHCNKYRSLAIVDATGLGDPICEDLIRQGLSVFPFKISNSSKKELISRLMVAIEQRQITFPNIPVLVEELGLYQYNVSDGGNITYGAPEGNNDDAVISLALAVTGMKNFVYGKKEKKILVRSDNAVVNGGFNY